jgi:hypothetical protein
MYIENDAWDRSSAYIYAVCAVDAHGISSPYSNQIGVRWNSGRNTIDVVHVSAQGAPKPYPNLFVEKDAFVDTMKIEGSSQMTVVFQPECYKLVDERDTDLNLLAFGPDNFYRIQLINTDLQQDDWVDVFITDARNTTRA